ncbi:hypothetical protein Tco_0079105 [Tanacetum coccineum]
MQFNSARFQECQYQRITSSWGGGGWEMKQQRLSPEVIQSLSQAIGTSTKPMMKKDVVANIDDIQSN